MVSSLAQRIGLTTAMTSVLICVLNFLNFWLFQGVTVVEAFSNPSVWVLALISLLLVGVLSLPERIVQIVQCLLFLSLAGPMVVSSDYDFFGMWFFILGLALLYKFGLLNRFAALKVSVALAGFVPFLIWGVLTREGLEGSVIRISNYSIFLFSCVLHLYFVFEEEIRQLVASNRYKDAEIAEKAAEIARLEPLSVLGERVAHVAHSFKNNLNQVSTALFLLEQLHDDARAAEKLREFSHTLNERIENILMVSRAGVDLEPEVFDVARVLEGMHQVYLQERTFLERVKTKITLEGPVLVQAVRWDFILMVENILKNALEAIVDTKGMGMVHIDLARGQLTIANDGGPIPLCSTCTDDCNHCQKYGRPGQTSKAGGSGHGLAQVMATCRNNGWSLRIRTHEDWTIFEVRFPHNLD